MIMENRMMIMENHVSACRKAFYVLQRAVLCSQGLNYKTAMHVWSTTGESVSSLWLGISTFNDTEQKILNQNQARLVKSIPGWVGSNYIVLNTRVWRVTKVTPNCTFLLLRNILAWKESRL